MDGEDLTLKDQREENRNLQIEQTEHLRFARDQIVNVVRLPRFQFHRSGVKQEDIQNETWFKS